MVLECLTRPSKIDSLFDPAALLKYRFSCWKSVLYSCSICLKPCNLKIPVRQPIVPSVVEVCRGSELWHLSS